MTDALKPFFFDTAAIDGFTIADIFEGSPDAEHYYDLFGKELLTKMIVQAPNFTVTHQTAPPGAKVKPHRHGVLQIDYVLAGELWFGNRRLTAGMGAFIPDTLYAWRAGDEGAQWIEIHSGGASGIYTERRTGDDEPVTGG